MTEQDIPMLLTMGKEHLYVWEMEPGMLHENDAAERLCRICKNEHMERSEVKEGKIELNHLYDYHALVNGMTPNAGVRATTEVTIPEGYECEDIFALLEENGVCSAEELAKAAASYEFDYRFLQDLPYGDTNRLEVIS